MKSGPVAVTIYHNPGCGTSRNTLALIRNAHVEPTIIEYLKMSPTRPTLQSLLQRMGIGPRALLISGLDYSMSKWINRVHPSERRS